MDIQKLQRELFKGNICVEHIKMSQENEQEFKAVRHCVLNKKRYNEIQQCIQDCTNDDKMTESILKNIRRIMKFDPDTKVYDENAKKHIYEYRERLKKQINWIYLKVIFLLNSITYYTMSKNRVFNVLEAATSQDTEQSHSTTNYTKEKILKWISTQILH